MVRVAVLARLDAGRHAHLSGHIAAALTAKVAESLSRRPTIERADVLAAKS